MRYVSPKYERMEIEAEDILSASGEAQEDVKVENDANGVADFIINASNLFKPNK